MAPTTRISEGTYCCYNALSRLDMRVQVTIPGSVESYCVDERGEKRKTTDDHWLETYLCSVLRAYSYADDGSGETIRKIMGVRRFNPVTNTETEHRFLNAAEQLFFRGWQLGSDSTVQVPNMVSNHLVSGLLKYFHTTGRFASGINLFQKLRSQNIEVASLLAKVLFMGNEEVEGVRALHQSLKDSPMDYVMLDSQAEFLLKKAQTAATPEQKEERLRMALGCADRSTIAAPSEFGTWARLAEVYVALEDWENALTILNSCPMFTYQDKDSPIMPEPKDVYLPTLQETRLDEIDSEPEMRFPEQVDPSLLSLRAAAYRGTFKQAYNILTEMTAKIGWDQLLKIRSNVFVMEDEYRNEKQEAGTGQAYPAKRNASTDALRGTPDAATNGERSDDGRSGDDDDDDDDEESKPDGESSDAPAALNGDAGVNESLEKPSTAADPGEKGDENVRKTPRATRPADTLSRSAELTTVLHMCRACRRRSRSRGSTTSGSASAGWTACHGAVRGPAGVHDLADADGAVPRAVDAVQEVAEEWEILGALAERLHHSDEAVEAYRACLGQRFSPKALSGILRVFERARTRARRSAPSSAWWPGSTAGTRSSRPSCCTPSARSSRTRAPSRYAASCRPPACRRTCST